MRITEVDKGLTQSELDQLEVFADRLFAKVGIDVEFTRHFLDRVNDERNVKQITASELTRLFKQEYKRWGKPIAQMGPDAEAVLKDLATDVNIPFALRWDKENNELDLIAKTVMRKKNFKTSNKEFEIQSADYSLDNIQHKKVFESIKQLNEAGPAVLALPAGVAAFELLAYSMAFATGAALVIDIQQNPEKYNWAMKQMAKAYTASVELMFGKDEAGAMPSQKELDAALVDATTTAIETLPTQVQTELSDSTKKIIADVEERAAIMDKQRADGVSPEVIAQTFIDSLTNKSEDEIAATTTAVTTGTSAEISSAISDELSKLEGTVDLPLQKAAAAIEAQRIAQAEIDKIDAQNATADAKLVALANAQAEQNKINSQNATADAKLIALGQQVAQQQADKLATELSDKKLIALGQAYADAKADAKATAQNQASDAKLIALAKAVSDVNDVTLNVPTDVATQNDINIGTITEPIGKDIDITVPGTTTGATAQGNAAAAAAAALAQAKAGANAQSTTADPNGSGNNRKGRSNKKKFDWGLGDGDYWDTDLYRWQQKYGTFENQNLIKKYFMINEGGAMPGVGAIHIDEITPTLQALEKSIGIDLMNNTLGSVGKRQFSGDIDVALQIQPEELPAFIEELKKNPLVLDIAKSSVIMTKVKIMDFDQSKSDGRPRTGFVQVDFMPGDPGWMKTYYHSPSETESKYKGVYRNIMIATLAAVHNRDQSDAKLDDGRAMEERRFMWSPTEGLLRVQRTPVPKKSGDGYTKKNKNETIDGPWKQPDEIATQLGLDSGKDLNSFESLLAAVKKNWTKEKLQYVIDGFKQNNVVQDIGVPEELDDVN